MHVSGIVNTQVLCVTFCASCINVRSFIHASYMSIIDAM